MNEKSHPSLTGLRGVHPGGAFLILCFLAVGVFYVGGMLRYSWEIALLSFGLGLCSVLVCKRDLEHVLDRRQRTSPPLPQVSASQDGRTANLLADRVIWQQIDVNRDLRVLLTERMCVRPDAETVSMPARHVLSARNWASTITADRDRKSE